MEFIIIFVINENILDVIGLIVVILLEENKCDFLIGRFFFEYMIFKNLNLLIIVNFRKGVLFKLLLNVISICRICRIWKIF